MNTVDANNSSSPATGTSIVPSPFTFFQGPSSPTAQGEAAFAINGVIFATTLSLPLNGSDLTFLFAIQFQEEQLAEQGNLYHWPTARPVCSTSF